MSAPKVHRIRIEKFRRIRDALELTLTTPKGTPSGTIVFAGPNGCGKTSVLEAILLGLGQEGLIVRDLRKSRREEHWRASVPAGATIELDVSRDGGQLETWVRTADKHISKRADGDTAVPRSVLKDMAVEYFSSWRAPELVGPVKPLEGRGKRPRDTETNRLWRLKQRINDERAKAGYAHAPVGAGISRADQWLDRINAAWKRFHGGDETKIDAQIVDQDAEDLSADLFVIKNGVRVCSVDQVSSGEIELLSFAGWVILNDFSGGVLVIDEPELHLHPEWQTAVLPALHELAPDTQFVVASHADAVWDQAYGFARFLLVSDDDPRSHFWRRKHGS